MHQKIAFQHPLRSDLIVSIGGEMPHLMKKICNAFERSGIKKSTNLKFRGKLMSLSMLKDLWQYGQMQGSLGDLRIDVLTDDHWPPKMHIQ